MTRDTNNSNGVNGHANKIVMASPLNRAAEVDDLVAAVQSLLLSFIKSADDAAPERAAGGSPTSQSSALVDPHPPNVLAERLALSLPNNGRGRDGLLDIIQNLLKYSVNTWDQGFLDKLYSSTNAVGVVSELVLSVLNTNLHVYNVSPALTVIERQTAKSFANLFGFKGPRAGGITCQGGSSSNLTSVVIARNALYPDTKFDGNGSYKFALFTSQHGHYSVEKAAIALGLGRAAVVSVPIDEAGCIIPTALREAVIQAKSNGKTPLYVNATAGTTVLGSYDPFRAISTICKEFNLWFHVDGSWGGSAIFSRQRHKLDGTELANSLTVNPHKMLNVPVTCSFLLTNDLSIFKRTNTLAAGYLFHGDNDEECANGNNDEAFDDNKEYWDLADLTLQCGRRGDALKLALAWVYYGAEGFEKQIDHAFAMASYLARLVQQHPDLKLVSSNPPPCLQVCFYYAPGGVLGDEKENTRRTREIVKGLIPRGFMIDYSPGPQGSFFRVVINCQTLEGTVEGLLKALEGVGRSVAV
ncbi:glutamate decarboxylase-like protein-like protein 1 [Truncatella angustata]|uniref:Glutamate decarboxylase-like protein-like protein 1 n=1 Tax=Truncatella angustata TaxID=152316 RepID=A0A9P8RJ98_9PEZI|nr:glutamate decarboxylase-like protein-like protein 1 [Truncatella angustata]KAH6645343.1 glutamate decarboxylase-like protein-like protein 1 [Truncatella angustata]